MFRYFRLKREVEDPIPPPGTLSAQMLERDAARPISLRQLNNLPENMKRRLYRGLIPPAIIARYRIDPLTWESAANGPAIELRAEPGSEVTKITIFNPEDRLDEQFALELQDNIFNSLDLNLIVISDPESRRFNTHLDDTGEPTIFGTVRRNLTEEKLAMESGLAPGQMRPGLGGSREVLEQLETFLAALGHSAYFLEPLSYVSAWLFERRGFAYVRGHKLMSEIHREFQPGGALYLALDGSSPFRRPEQWKSVRGRAWAIQDGILNEIGAHWDKLRMIKQVGRHASVETFPGSVY